MALLNIIRGFQVFVSAPYLRNLACLWHLPTNQMSPFPPAKFPLWPLETFSLQICSSCLMTMPSFQFLGPYLDFVLVSCLSHCSSDICDQVLLTQPPGWTWNLIDSLLLHHCFFWMAVHRFLTSTHSKPCNFFCTTIQIVALVPKKPLVASHSSQSATSSSVASLLPNLAWVTLSSWFFLLRAWHSATL